MTTTLAFEVLDFLGVFVFALSGALAADRRGMDLFGFVVIALLPAVGGGTLRDVLLDVPVFWVENPGYLWPCLIAALATWVLANELTRVQRLLLWADAIGLSVFGVTGAAKALSVTGEPVIAVLMGVMSAVVGGLLRDVVCNEVPTVLREDVYATAAFAGALLLVAWTVTFGPSALALWTSALLCFWIRGLALVHGWSLPRRGVPLARRRAHLRGAGSEGRDPPDAQGPAPGRGGPGSGGRDRDRPPGGDGTEHPAGDR